MKHLARTVLLLTLLGLTGCLYQVGSLIPADVKTIHVEMFENATFRRELEIALTEAVQREIRRRTHLRLTAKDNADTILTGEVVDFRGRTEVKDVEDDVFSQDVTVYVNMKWVDRRTGRVLAKGTRLNRPVRIFTTRGDTVAAAAVESFRYLAETIVDRMEGGW